MMFCRRSVKFCYQYNIDLVELSKIDCVKDLVFLFDSKLTLGLKRPAYSTRCALFGMSSLENRRKMFSIIFIRESMS